MWIHSKFNYVSELSFKFSDPPCSWEVMYSALCCVLSIAFVWNDACVCCVVRPKRAADKCQRNLYDLRLCIFNSLLRIDQSKYNAVTFESLYCEGGTCACISMSFIALDAITISEVLRLSLKLHHSKCFLAACIWGRVFFTPRSLVFQG